MQSAMSFCWCVMRQNEILQWICCSSQALLLHLSCLQISKRDRQYKKRSRWTRQQLPTLILFGGFCVRKTPCLDRAGCLWEPAGCGCSSGLPVESRERTHHMHCPGCKSPSLASDVSTARSCVAITNAAAGWGKTRDRHQTSVKFVTLLDCCDEARRLQRDRRQTVSCILFYWTGRVGLSLLACTENCDLMLGNELTMKVFFLFLSLFKHVVWDLRRFTQFGACFINYY